MKHWIRLLCLPLFAIAASMVSAQNVTEISTVQQLKAFRDAVNAGSNYAGQTVKLTADLDLNGETWSPIGQEGTNVANSKIFALRAKIRACAYGTLIISARFAWKLFKN